MTAHPRQHLRIDRLCLIALAVIVVAFGAVRMYGVSRHGSDFGHGRELSGSQSYARIADDVLANGPGWQLVGARMPLYPALVVLAKLLGGNYWSYVLISIQAALAFLCGLMCYRIAQQLTPSTWVPALVTMAYALHPSLHLEHFALRESVVFEFLILAFFYLASRPAVSARNIVWMTLSCIAAYYTRATGVLFAVPLVLYLAFMPASSRRLRLARLGSAVGAMILAAVPWQMLESHVQGQVALGATSVGGVNFFKGNARAFEEVSPYIDHDLGDAYLPQLLELQPARPGVTPPNPTDAELRRLAWADIRSDSMRFVRKAFLKVIVYLSPLQTPLGHANLAVKDGRLVLRDYEGDFVEAYGDWLAFAEQMSFFVVLFAVPLGFLGMARSLILPNRLRPIAVAGLGFVLANIAAHAAITAETRYRMYLDPLFLVWAGVTMEYLFARGLRVSQDDQPQRTASMN